MIIKQDKSSFSFKPILNFYSSLQFWKYFSFFLLVIFLFFIGIFFSFAKQKLPQVQQKIHQSLILPIQKTYYKKTTNPPVWDLEISFENLQIIEKKRQQALLDGVLITNDDDYVKAKLNINGQKKDVKIRLKGDWTDHLEGKKWSYRVKVSDDQTIMGMKVFSIQAPDTRNFLNEWLFFQNIKELGLIALRYDFIELKVNGQSVGMMAVEEHFSKELIENNQRREGPILKISEDRFWENGLKYSFVPGIEEGLIYRSPIDGFKLNSTLTNPTLSQEYERAVYLLENYRADLLSAAEVFDLDLWAKFIALSDVYGANHGLHSHNLRFYYNPVNGLIEPVAFDMMSENQISRLALEEDNFLTLYTGLVENKDFIRLYIGYLNQFSQDSYFQQLINHNQSQLDLYTSYLKRDYDYNFNYNLLTQNQQFIRKKLTDHPSVSAYYQNDQKLILTNLTELPVEITSLIIFTEGQDSKQIQTGKTILDFSVDPIYLPGSSRQEAPVQIAVYLDQNLDTSNLEQYQLVYHFVGMDQLVNVSLQPVTLLEDVPFLETTNLPNFVVYDSQKNQYLIRKGTYQLDQPLVIPSGSTFKFEEGVHLDLINSSYIISYSSLILDGSRNDGIIINSSDNTGQGLFVINANDISHISYTRFSNLSHPQIKGYNISSSIGFYNSPVNIVNSVFENNSAEDMLNIIRSKFVIDQTSFANSFADSLDVDFGQGEILNSIFRNSGNDSIDVSGSYIDVRDTQIENAGDKAVSAGERSYVSLENVSSTNSNLGFVSKDLSEMSVKVSNIYGGNFGFVTYQKKSEYGPGSLEIWNTSNSANQQYLLEANSLVKYNGSIVPAISEDVYQLLYDDEN